LALLQATPKPSVPLLTGIGGRYFEDCNEAVPVPDNNGYVSGGALLR
jgi:hypothetical protein